MSLPFRGDLVRIRRNKWVLGAAAIPLALPIVGALSSGRALGLALVFQAIAMALGILALVWRKNPWPSREVVPVSADALGVEVDGERIPRESLAAGFVVPAAGETKVVLERRGVRPNVELVAQGVNEARRVLLGLGFDASQTVATFRTLSRVFADLRRLFIPIAIVPFAVALGILSKHAHPGLGVLAFLLPLFAFIGVMLVPSRVTVGADGIEIRWLGRRRFIRHADIDVAVEYETGTGNSRYSGVSLMLASGEEVRIPVGQSRLETERVKMILERIEEAAAEGKRPHAELDPALLARGGRDVADWMRALRAMGAGGNVTMRTAPIDPEQLWRIVEDPAGAAAARVAAAVALTAEPTADARRRLRAAAEATAAPKLRIAIDAAATADEDALREALSEIEAESGEERSEA